MANPEDDPEGEQFELPKRFQPSAETTRALGAAAALLVGSAFVGEVNTPASMLLCAAAMATGYAAFQQEQSK